MTTAKRPPATQTVESANPIRLISKAEVCDRVGKTFPTIWLWMRQGRFPRARELAGSPVWIASEIEAFCAALPERGYMGDAGYVPPAHVKAARRRATAAA
jgi:predicted DNA-binding transcriptional regulator AlpA